jgi:hypothetical protein
MNKILNADDVVLPKALMNIKWIKILRLKLKY